MDARLHDLTMTRDGAAILSLRVPVSAASAIYDELKDADVTVEIKKKRNRRSLAANDYAWVLMNKIAEKARVSVLDVYRNAIRNVGGNMTSVCVQNEAAYALQTNWAKNGKGWITDVGESKIPGCTVVFLYTGSSSFDTAQMSRLIDNIIQDAKALGIETMPPKELGALLEHWGEKHG